MTEDAQDSGRRKADRRKQQKPIDGEDRRTGERRAGEDRRTTQRTIPDG
jgi:hypothetical protein